MAGPDAGVMLKYARVCGEWPWRQAGPRTAMYMCLWTRSYCISYQSFREPDRLILKSSVSIQMSRNSLRKSVLQYSVGLVEMNPLQKRLYQQGSIEQYKMRVKCVISLI